MSRSTTVRALSMGILLAGALVSSAIAHDDDVGVGVDNGVITTWSGGELYLAPNRVFAGELVFDAGLGLPTADEPGYASVNQPALAGRALSFDLVGALHKWSGGPDGNFDAVSPVRLGLGSDELDLDFVLTPTDDETITGHVLAFAGDFDFHFDMRLQADEQGIYLFAMRLSNPGGPLDASLPYYFVLNYGLDEAEHDAAIEYVTDRIVPAPASSAALLLGTIAAMRRRRR